MKHYSHQSESQFSITEAYRYLANAKETISKSSIEYGRYTDSKYVSEAAGIAYLAALKAINTFLLSRGVSDKELPTSIEEYRFVVRQKMPHNGKLMAALHIVYQNLHLFAYYRGGTELQMVKSGFENSRKIIDMIGKSLGEQVPLMASEPKVKYRITQKNELQQHKQTLNPTITQSGTN